MMEVVRLYVAVGANKKKSQEGRVEGGRGDRGTEAQRPGVQPWRLEFAQSTK